MRYLQHATPTVSFTLTVNIHADRSLLFLAGLLWLLGLQLPRLARRCELALLRLVLGVKGWVFDGWGEDLALIGTAVAAWFGRYKCSPV